MSMVDITENEKKIAERIDPNAVSNLAVSDAGGGLSFNNASQLMDFAKLMSIAKGGIRAHLRGNPGACLAIVTQAVEWGLSPFAVANKSYFVNDQIAFESQLVQAIILKRAPIRGRLKFEFFGEGEQRYCRAWAKLREDGEIIEFVSPTIARITPKNSPLWRNDPDQQLAYYSGRALCRRHFPDILLGIYDEDEIERTPRRPDQARDVTPPKSLSDKLDALSMPIANNVVEPDPVREADPDPEPVIAHDPETGEIDPDAEPLVEDVPPIADYPELSPREQTISDVRSELLVGKKLTVVLNALDHRRNLLTDDDVRILRGDEVAVRERLRESKS